jgi:hypothetical protein
MTTDRKMKGGGQVILSLVAASSLTGHLGCLQTQCVCVWNIFSTLRERVIFNSITFQ